MRLFCSNCGKEIPEIAKFCPFCGEEVIFNRNNPDAKEFTKEELENQKQEDPQTEAVESPVIEEKPQPQKPVCDERLANQYRREIEQCKKNRKTMVTLGIVLTSVFFAIFASPWFSQFLIRFALVPAIPPRVPSPVTLA